MYGILATVPTNGGFWAWVGFLIQEYGLILLKGCGWTLLLAIVGTIVGCVLGFLCGFIQTIEVIKTDIYFKKISVWVLKTISTIYVEVFRGTPMMVQAMVIFYGLPLIGITIDAIPCGFLVVSINTGAYMAESVRGGIISVDPGQMEGAKAIGMTHVQAMKNVILPQAIRNIMPQIGNNLIINIKDTSVLSVISIVDLFFVHKSVAGALYTYFESATIVMAIYLTMTLVTSRLLLLVEKRMDGDANYELVDTMDIGNQLRTVRENDGEGRRG